MSEPLPSLLNPAEAMTLALSLAREARADCPPNPAVGCVLALLLQPFVRGRDHGGHPLTGRVQGGAPGPRRLLGGHRLAPPQQRVAPEGYDDSHGRLRFHSPRVATITALIVCIRFSA